jgi:streptomycin 6-kinase
MAGLPRVVDGLAGRWSLELGRPFQPGGVASWVAPARRRSGERVVLKVAWRHDEALHEADGLRAWAGGGAVHLYDAVVDRETAALLLEACEPGSALTVLPPLDQDLIVAGLLRRLWMRSTPGKAEEPGSTRVWPPRVWSSSGACPDRRSGAYC